MAVVNTLAYYDAATIKLEESFIVLAHGIDLIKLFLKLHHLVDVSHICLGEVKRKDLAYKKRVSHFHTKKIMSDVKLAVFSQKEPRR
jgi:hypothetical protein